MFRKKKDVVLTETTCKRMENLRLAIEVLTGKPIRIKQLDFNTGQGQIYIRDVATNLFFKFVEENTLRFSLVTKNCYLCRALFLETGAVAVDKPFRAIGMKNETWMGFSKNNRWLETKNK